MGKIFWVLAWLTAAIWVSTTALDTAQAQFTRPVIDAVRRNTSWVLEKKEPILDDIKKQVKEIYKWEIVDGWLLMEKDGVKLYQFKINKDWVETIVLFVDKDKTKEFTWDVTDKIAEWFLSEK